MHQHDRRAAAPAGREEFCDHAVILPSGRGSLKAMPVVKINAIEVPPNAGPELEKRFANRAHAVDSQPGFLGFQLLRPVKGEDRYFVVTQWESEEAFQAWASGPAVEAHKGQHANPVATGASLLEFEVVLDVAGPGTNA
ncbi:mycobilin-forming heme oxygenase MhuD [Mycolicibacterium mageritense]|nr:monooxygenase [Mycolicibacterium mageritense]